jgi:hypothetical protein
LIIMKRTFWRHLVLILPLLFFVILAGCGPRRLPPVRELSSFGITADEMDISGFSLVKTVSNPVYSRTGETYLFLADVRGSKRKEIIVSTCRGTAVLDSDLENCRVVSFSENAVPAPFMIDADRDDKYDILATGRTGASNYLLARNAFGGMVAGNELRQTEYNFESTIVSAIAGERIYCVARPGDYTMPRGVLCFDVRGFNLLWDCAVPAVPEEIFLLPDTDSIFISHTTSDQGVYNFIGREKEHLTGGDSVLRRYEIDNEGRYINFAEILDPSADENKEGDKLRGTLFFTSFRRGDGSSPLLLVHTWSVSAGKLPEFQLLRLRDGGNEVAEKSAAFRETFTDIKIIETEDGQRCFVLSRKGTVSIIREFAGDLSIVRTGKTEGVSFSEIDAVVSPESSRTYFFCRTDRGCIVLDNTFTRTAEIPGEGLRRIGAFTNGDGGRLSLLLAGKTLDLYETTGYVLRQ